MEMAEVSEFHSYFKFKLEFSSSMAIVSDEFAKEEHLQPPCGSGILYNIN